MAVTPGTRTDGSYGRIKQDVVAATDLDTQQEAACHNRIVDGLIALETDHNALADRCIYHFGGAFSAAATNTWYGLPFQSVWLAGTMTQTYGNGADPATQVYNIWPQAPVALKINEVNAWYRVSGAAVGGDFRLYKIEYADGTATTTETQLGTTMTVASGGSASNRYDMSTTFVSANTLAAGDGFAPFFRNTDTAGGSCYVNCTLVMEFV